MAEGEEDLACGPNGIFVACLNGFRFATCVMDLMAVCLFVCSFEPWRQIAFVEGFSSFLGILNS